MRMHKHDADHAHTSSCPSFTCINVHGGLGIITHQGIKSVALCKGAFGDAVSDNNLRCRYGPVRVCMPTCNPWPVALGLQWLPASRVRRLPLWA